MTTILLLILIAFVLTGLFAGSEMAYVSCNKLKLRHLADQGDRRAKEVLRFHLNPKRFLTTVLIGNNLMHVTVVGLATYLFESRFHISNEWLITFVLSFPIIIFAETVPKDWFRYKADEFIYRVAPTIGFLDRVLGGVSGVMVSVTDFFIRLTTKNLKSNPMITRDEFRYVIEESARGGVLLEHEKRLINTILNLSTAHVGDVMIQITKFPKVPLTSCVRDVKDVARRTQTDAVLVYEEIPSLVVGIVYVFDVLFDAKSDEFLSRFLRAPLFIPHDTSSEKAIFLLQSKHVSYAAVINAKKEVTGVVCLENLVQL
ncbi:MAG: hypothetical protein A3G87_03200 [Omnitrophica bacterium RIFCSPLOWO2_12_FULL_50_11]|nr:MAG: hypothetical protein A3G87_03200 [Omnitrophica bacterium RIFCSPLOWO2_12_FULL_50_11]